MAKHPDRRAALPGEPDSGRALISLAVNPDEPHQRQGQTHSPWQFPSLHWRKDLTPIPEIHLQLSFQEKSSRELPHFWAVSTEW